MNNQELSREEQLLSIATQGFQMLKKEKNYKQNQIINKLRTLNSEVSTASFSNLLSGKAVGSDVLQKVASGVQEIIRSELGAAYQTDKFETLNVQNWQPILIKETPQNPLILENNTTFAGFTFHSAGRVPIHYKTNFIQSAQSDIIEVGTRLKTFTEYFFSRNEQEYKAHIEALLERGINMRFYMLDPESNEARLYFADRAKAKDQADEKDSMEEMRKILIKIEKIHDEFKAKNLKGEFEVFLYKHIPTNHFFVVDGKTHNGKMMVSHYLYGVSRADCPVMEIDKNLQPLLFKKYFKSMQSFTEGAKRVIPKP